MTKLIKFKKSNDTTFLPAENILIEGGGETLDKLFDLVYPVGSIYLSISSASPSTLFGGTWEKMSGGYLYGCINSIDNNVTNTPGASTYGTAITIDQMPSHNHGRLRWDSSSGRTSSLNSGGSSYRWNWDLTGNGNDGFYMEYQGGNQAHLHDVPHIGVWVWKRTA